ncbi:class I SAM-dependent methyltransferase [Flindersiella endophytica]
MSPRSSWQNDRSTRGQILAAWPPFDAELPWSYEDRATAAMAASSATLDLDTGGGETLARVHEQAGTTTPGRIVATEAWAPNVPVARERLEPLGIEVRHSGGPSLPATDAEFDLVLNRHGAFDPAELRRVLEPGGTFLSQQVGHDNDIELNAALDAPRAEYSDNARFDRAISSLEQHGFEIIRAEESFTPFTFLDIGAIVFHLRIVSWQIPGFDVDTYDQRLRELDRRVRSDGGFVVHHHRYFVEATRRT